MKAYTTHKTPTASTPSGNCLASNTVRIARLVFALIVVLAQPVHAQGTSPDAQQVRTELGTVVTDLRAALAQLARIEAEAATLPKTFTAGGQTQNRWNQLNAEKERWTTEQGKALDRFDQLVTQSKALPPGNAAVADLLTICTQLLARNDVALKAAQSKLSGIEGTLRRGPSTFAKGSQIEVWQTQLNREKEYWTGNFATLGKEHEKLAAQLSTLKAQSNRAKVVAAPPATEPAKVVAAPPATEPAKVVAAPTATEPAKVVAAPTAQTTTQASVPSIQANDKTYALLDDLVGAIKAWQQYKKEGNEVEATIQSDLIEKLRRNPAWLDECMTFGGLADDVYKYDKAPEKALAALAKYRADYPAIRAEYDKKRAFSKALAARRKEEADKDQAERDRVERESNLKLLQKSMAREREMEKARAPQAEFNAAMNAKPIANLEDAVARVAAKLGAGESKIGKTMVSTGGLIPRGTKLYPVRFANGLDAYFFQDAFDEWSFNQKGTDLILKVSDFKW